jgi:Flp pilus assembly protein TadG
VAAVEFACFLPVLVFLILGMFEINRVIYVNEILDDAARKACRVACAGGTAESDVVKAANDVLSANNLPTLSQNTTGSGAGIYIYVSQGTSMVLDTGTLIQNGKPFDEIQIQVSINVSDALLFWPQSFYQSATLNSQSLTMVRLG